MPVVGDSTTGGAGGAPPPRLLLLGLPHTQGCGGAAVVMVGGVAAGTPPDPLRRIHTITTTPTRPTHRPTTIPTRMAATTLPPIRLPHPTPPTLPTRRTVVRTAGERTVLGIVVVLVRLGMLLGMLLGVLLGVLLGMPGETCTVPLRVRHGSRLSRLTGPSEVRSTVPRRGSYRTTSSTPVGRTGSDEPPWKRYRPFWCYYVGQVNIGVALSHSFSVTYSPSRSRGVLPIRRGCFGGAGARVAGGRRRWTAGFTH